MGGKEGLGGIIQPPGALTDPPHSTIHFISPVSTPLWLTSRARKRGSDGEQRRGAYTDRVGGHT